MSSFSQTSDSSVIGDNRFLLVSACYLMAIGGLEFCIMPIFLGAMATHLSYSEQQVGFVGAAYLLGFVLTSFSGVFWARRISWRYGTLASALVACLAYLVCLVVGDYNVILMMIFIVGCTRGVFYAISICSLGDGEEAERYFALGTLASMAFAGVGMLLLPYAIAKWEMAGLILPMVVLSAIAIFLIQSLPVHGMERATSEQSGKSGMNIQVFVGLCALLIFWIGMGGVWAFLERIGNASGLSAQSIGIVLAVSYGAVIAVAALAAWLGDRAGRGIPIFIGIVGMWMGIMCMNQQLTSVTYMMASLLFQCGWIFSYPYMMAVINKGDVTGRFVPLIAAAQGLGAAVGSGLGGSIISAQAGYFALYMMGFAALLVSLVLFGWVLFLQRPVKVADATDGSIS